MKCINKFLFEAKQKFNIYLDLDGVLTNLEGAVSKLGLGTFDELEKRSPGLVWKLIAKEGVKFWSQMEWMKDGRKLWDYVKHYPVTILSAPTKNPSSIKGKNIWINIELGKDVKRIIVPRKEKKNYANQHSILIDDMVKNISEWKTDGGIGILHEDAETTIKKLKSILGGTSEQK